MILATFGDLQLRILVNDFQSFTKSQEYGYGTHDKLLTKPSLQQVGDGLAKMNFSFLFHRQLIDPELGLLQFRAIAESKEPQGFVFGEVYKGQWVVSRLEENVLKVEVRENQAILNCVAHRVELLEFTGVKLRQENVATINPFGFLA